MACCNSARVKRDFREGHQGFEDLAATRAALDRMQVPCGRWRPCRAASALQAQQIAVHVHQPIRDSSGTAPFHADGLIAVAQQNGRRAVRMFERGDQLGAARLRLRAVASSNSMRVAARRADTLALFFNARPAPTAGRSGGTPSAKALQGGNSCSKAAQETVVLRRPTV